MDDATINGVLEPIVWILKSPLDSATIAYVRAFGTARYRVTDSAGSEIGRYSSMEEAESNARGYMNALLDWGHERAARRLPNLPIPTPDELRQYASREQIEAN